MPPPAPNSSGLATPEALKLLYVLLVGVVTFVSPFVCGLVPDLIDDHESAMFCEVLLRMLLAELPRE